MELLQIDILVLAAFLGSFKALIQFILERD